MTRPDAADKALLLRLTLLLGGPALIIGTFALGFIRWRFHLSFGFLAITLALLVPAIWMLILLVEHGIARSADGLVTVLNAGHAAPPGTGFSRQEALVAQGRLEDAAVAYRLHLADHPQDVAALVALGRLLGGPLSDPDGAAAAYRTARQTSQDGRWDRIISDDLIDLYARTNQEGKLLVELARFGDFHRGTKAGDAARARLRELKQRGE